MPVNLKSRIQVRHGLQEDLGQLATGEFGFSVDAQRLFIGSGTLDEGSPVVGNTEILTQNQLNNIISIYTGETGNIVQVSVNLNDNVPVAIITGITISPDEPAGFLNYSTSRNGLNRTGEFEYALVDGVISYSDSFSGDDLGVTLSASIINSEINLMYATTATGFPATLLVTETDSRDGSNQGVPGQSASLTIGIVTELPSGDTPTVTNSGTGTNAILNFGLPAGIPGPPGVALSGITSLRVSSPLNSANLLDPTQAQVGITIDAGSGQEVANGELTTSALIPANTSGQMTTENIVNSNVAGVTFWDQTSNFISGLSIVNISTTPFTFNVPGSAAFVRITYATTDVSNLMLVNGPTLPTIFQAFTYYPSNIVDTKISSAVSESTGNLVSGSSLMSYVESAILTQNNLFIPENATQGTAISFSNSITTSLPDNFFVTDFIPVISSGNVVCNQDTTIGGQPQYGFAFYDLNKTYVSGIVGTGPGVAVSVPDNVAFTRTSFQTGIGSGLQICATANLAPSFEEQVTTVTTAALPLVGKQWMPWGDSITSKIGGYYQQFTINALGLTVTKQDARGGRQTNEIFENYSNNPATGIGLGGIGIPNDGQVDSENRPFNFITGVNGSQELWATPGNTLAQDLANVDLVTVYLGTNDATLAANIGALGDAIGSGTYYGYLRYAIEGLINAKPSLKIIWITPMFNDASGSSTAAIVTAQLNICASYGIPVLNQFYNSGINSINVMSVIGSDGVHPAMQANIDVIGRAVTGFITSHWY